MFAPVWVWCFSDGNGEAAGFFANNFDLAAKVGGLLRERRGAIAPPRTAAGGRRRGMHTARRAERWTDSCEPDWGVHGSGGVLCRLLDARNADDEPPTIWRYQQ